MGTRDIAYVSGAAVRWARERARLEAATLASKLGKGFTAAHVSAWEAGQSFPTLSQAERLADSLYVPLAILFMQDPPDIALPLPDFRTVSGERPGPPSPEFFDVLNDALIRQHWYREYQLREKRPPLEFVGRFRLGDDVARVAADVSSTLGIDDQTRRDCETWQGFLTRLIEAAEGAGILVMVSNLVRHATSRPLNVSEFRGFTSADRLAPLIFLNSRDARAGLVFTLAHELAHVWIAASGISSSDPRRRWSDFSSPVERYCNAVAAEFLLPEANFKGAWRETGTIEEKIARISAFHRVSKIVTIIRARELGALSYEQSRNFIDAEYARFEEQRERQKEKEGGPVFWTLFPSRNSARLTDAVLGELQYGRVTFRDAAYLLGVKLGTLEKYRAQKAG
ncbi:MAG TPA: XRE family transcriptional regulator [Candidatus Acidoferrales bacterium]|nr:XRE family transcriptional regulator [Candidatus Acidoferrales bacterium]